MKISGVFGFIGCADHQRCMGNLISRFGVNYCVETGTLHGWTTAFFAERVKHVYTIEIEPENLEKAKFHLDGYQNVQIIQGNSVDMLPSIVKSIPTTEKVLFYLDAHWRDYWPLFDELDIIAKHVGPRAIIVIDDFKVPGKEYTYDTYNGVENCLEAVDPYLKRIYPSYSYEYFDGVLDYEVTLDKTIATAVEMNLHDVWFKGQTKRTTGKIAIYAN